MPTQDTWTSIAGAKSGSYNGRVRTWIRTPGYGSLPKDSKPVNRYDDMNRKYSQGSYYAKRTHKVNGTVDYAFAPGYIWTGTGLDTNLGTALTSANASADVYAAESESMSRALVAISDAKVNLAVALAEARKTSDLILSTANRIDRAYRAFRRGNLREVASLLDITPKRLHKSWLSYKYGWMPLLMDVKGAAEFFAQQHIGRPARFVVHGRALREKTVDLSFPFTPYGGLPQATLQRSIQWKNAAHTKIWCELTHPHYAELQQLGLTNPALVAWELVPYSFVFDWFYSVGSWLQGLTALQGVSVRRVMQTSYIDATWTQSAPSTVRSDATYTYEELGYSASAKRKQFGRGAPSVDPLALKIPKGNGLDFTRLVTSLALLRANSR